MCLSAPKNKATDEASKAEAERIAAIGRTQQAVNGVFDGPARAAEISDYVGANRAYGTDLLNRQKSDTDRELKFALARGGLTGGSTQVDQQRRFGETYVRGLLDVERKAQSAGASIEGADQDARARLITLATTGLDATTAASQSAAAMRSNLAAGAQERNAGMVGDAFGAFKGFIDRTREAADRRRADGMFANLYGNTNSGYGNS